MTRLRIIFSAAGGHGHLQPLLPLAQEAARSGHQVRVLAAPALGGHVTELGLRFVPCGPDLVPVRSDLTLRTVDEEREAIPRHFIGRLGSPRAREIVEEVRTWRADLIVGDETDYGAMVAAESVGLPHASVIISGVGGMVTAALIRAPLEALRSDAGLPDEDGTAMLERSLKLNPFPPGLRDPAHPLTGSVVNYRTGTVPPHPPVITSDVRIYVTLGTIFNTESGDLLRRITAAVAAMPRVGSVVVATGDHIDPRELGPQPGNVSIHRFVPQRKVLAACSAVVGHGGSGTMLDALMYGLPMVLLPLGADQPLNAARCSDLGCAVALRADTVSADQIAQAVDKILADPAPRNVARELQKELSRQASIEDAIRSLERHSTAST